MKKKFVVIAHIVFWVLALTVELLPLVTVNDMAKVRDALVEETFITLFCVIVFYSFYLFIGPKILTRNRIMLFLGVFIAFIVLYTALIMTFYPRLLFSIIDPPDKPVSIVRWYFFSFSYHFVYALWGTMFRFSIDWFGSKQKEKELEKQNISSELALLRSQINPHFLFNTLNNINSFVHRDPDKTSFGIIRLSEIMRYMLYEANADKVLLEKELNYISSYIDLQKLRVSTPDYVSITVDGDVNGIMVPPMLLIPFIENAFKHGRKKVNGPGVYIRIRIDQKTLEFEIKNYLVKVKQKMGEEGGFGLKNIKRRLDLIYGKNYELKCETGDEMFTVHLNISEL